MKDINEAQLLVIKSYFETLFFRFLYLPRSVNADEVKLFSQVYDLHAEYLQKERGKSK